MDEFLHAEADRLGITRAEVMRRIFDIYRDSREEGFNCPNCEVTIKHDLR
jgi:hypothetical protein